MATTAKCTTTVGVFSTRASADKAIAELKKATTTQWKENQGAFRPSCCRDEPVAEIVY